MKLATGRKEKRNSRTVPVQWWKVQQPAFSESATTENLSPHGARIVTSHTLKPLEHLFVTMPGMRSRLKATVIYCHPVGKGKFGAGLHLLGAA